MINVLINFIDRLGPTGLIVVMAIEGSSFPFPGVFLVFVYGYVLNFSFVQSLGFAFAMSLAYSVASYIPYAIGYRIRAFTPKRFRKQWIKARHLFHKYGLWSIVLTRPFGVGNYISYVAGMFRVKGWTYGLLTFIGIYPWSVAMLWLGRLFKGNAQIVQKTFQSYQGHIFASVVFVSVCLVILYVRRKQVS